LSSSAVRKQSSFNALLAKAKTRRVEASVQEVLVLQRAMSFFGSGLDLEYSQLGRVVVGRLTSRNI